VNQEIRANHESSVHVTTPEAAIASGAMGLFGEKYGSEVRVVSFGESVELCGGTHAGHTGDIGFFKITAESGVASGIRRIEAVTGEAAILWVDAREAEFKKQLQIAEEKIRQLEKQLAQSKEKLATNIGQDLASQAVAIKNAKVLATTIAGVDGKALRSAVDQLKNKLSSAIIVLATVNDTKVSIVAGVTKDHVLKVSAGELIKMLSAQLGGKGGGRADMAEGGGNQPENLEQALQSVYKWVEEKLG